SSNRTIRAAQTAVRRKGRVHKLRLSRIIWRLGFCTQRVVPAGRAATCPSAHPTDKSRYRQSIIPRTRNHHFKHYFRATALHLSRARVQCIRGSYVPIPRESPVSATRTSESLGGTIVRLYRRKRIPLRR